MKLCKNCKWCIGFQQGYYICEATEQVEWVEQCIGDDPKLNCDLYVDNLDDDN